MQIRPFYYEIRKLVFIFLAFIFSPIIYFFIWKRKKYFDKNKQLRILVIPQLNRIGDIVCSTPVFRAIKKQYPDCFLGVLIQKSLSGILKNNPHIDEILPYQSIDFMGVLQKARLGNFNWGFCLSGTTIGSLVMFLGFIPNRVKLTREERPMTEALTDLLVPNKFLYKHHTYLLRYYLKLLEIINIRGAEEAREVFTTPIADQKVENYLFQKGLAENDFLVGISISAGNKIKEWGDEKFKILAERIVAKYSAKVEFIGSKNDETRIDNILSRLDNKNYFKGVDFSLEELPSLIKKLNLFIAVDTGPIYIAHALKVPLVDIIGPVDPTEQPPEDERSILVRPTPGIKPSSFVFKKPGKPEEHKKALESITIESVLIAVDKLTNKFGRHL